MSTRQVLHGALGRAWAMLFALLAGASLVHAEPLRVGVSWSNFQEERWKTDEAALVEALEALGATVLSSDAQSSSEKQLADVETLLARGARVLVIVAHDARAIGPAIALANAEGVPVVAYDRVIESPGVFYISFDNVEVGRIQAREVLKRRDHGRFVYIKGAPTDPNSDLVHRGQREVMAPYVESGAVQIVGDQYVEGWLPEVAQRVMEQILTANEDRVDAVICSNDAMAGGVVAALRAQGISGLPLSGQDGDHAALARVARGEQSVSVWKDARALGKRAAEVAIALAGGADPATLDGVVTWQGDDGLELDAILLSPEPITRERLGLVIESGWVPKDVVCRGVGADPPPACR